MQTYRKCREKKSQEEEDGFLKCYKKSSKHTLGREGKKKDKLCLRTG